MRWRRSDPAGVALSEECEAFLAGAYVELCESRGEPVPVWAWMNLLAHGTEAQLRAGVTQHPGADSGVKRAPSSPLSWST